MFENFRPEPSKSILITFTQGEKTMKAMKKLTAIVCIIGMSMIVGAQAIAADGLQTKQQIKKHTQTQTMSGTQSGTMTRTRSSQQ